MGIKDVGAVQVCPISGLRRPRCSQLYWFDKLAGVLK